MKLKKLTKKTLKGDDSYLDDMDRLTIIYSSEKTVAKLATYTARDYDRLASKSDVVVFANGTYKQKLVEEFQAYKKRKSGTKAACVLGVGTLQDGQ